MVVGGDNLSRGVTRTSHSKGRKTAEGEQVRLLKKGCPYFDGEESFLQKFRLGQELWEGGIHDNGSMPKRPYGPGERGYRANRAFSYREKSFIRERVRRAANRTLLSKPAEGRRRDTRTLYLFVGFLRLGRGLCRDEHERGDEDCRVIATGGGQRERDNAVSYTKRDTLWQKKKPGVIATREESRKGK